MSSASKLTETLRGQIGESEWVTPMAALAVRFSCRGLHVGKTVAPLIDRLLDAAPEGTRWNGVIPKVGGRTRVAKPLSAARRKACINGLSKLTKLPTEATMLYADDSEDEPITPESFGLYLSLVDPKVRSFCAPGGYLMVAWSMERLEEPNTLIAECEAIVRELSAEVAWLGPSMWLAPNCLYNASSNEFGKYGAFFAQHPQISVPSIQAHAHPFHFAAAEQGLDVFEGVVAPAWTTWLRSSISKRVHGFPGKRSTHKGLTRLTMSETVPFRMSEKNYSLWRDAWSAMKPARLLLEVPEELDFPSVWNSYYGRLEAPSWRSSKAAAKRTIDAALKEREIHIETMQRFEHARRNHPEELLAVAEEALGKTPLSGLLWGLAHDFPSLVKAGHARPSDVEMWLRRGLEEGLPGKATQAAEGMASAAVAAKQEALAFEILMCARPKTKAGRKEWMKRLERISPVRRLRRDPRWASLA